MLGSNNFMKLKKKTNGKNYNKGIMIIMSVAVIVIIMVSMNEVNNSNNRRRLIESTGTTTTDIDTDLTISYIDFYTGNRSISCYNNESSSNYGGSTKNLTCSTSGYVLTGCSSSQSSSKRYGVYSDGTYCYAKHIDSGKEVQGDLLLQARCCKANKGVLNMKYLSNNSISVNKCNTLSCSNTNQTAVGSAITLYGNTYSKEFLGNTYSLTTGLSGIYSYGGNNTQMRMGVFCASLTTSLSYKLQCVTQMGNYVSGYGISSVNCTSDYKLTACDSLHRPFYCSTDATSYLYGSIIYNNTCYSEGTNHTAVARCCTIV